MLKQAGEFVEALLSKTPVYFEAVTDSHWCMDVTRLFIIQDSDVVVLSDLIGIRKWLAYLIAQVVD